ncbi:cell cycle checkpoint control protein rad9a [Actinomortierella wolfii]|nr:cell cycle checkpoint control protein rad9a [Actinomortierella wolfii]
MTSGGAKTHKLRYQSCDHEPQVKYDKTQCSNHWALASSTLMGSLEHFSSKVEEIVMECKTDSITFKSVKDDNEGGVGFSSIEIESYTLREEVELTFSMKEFKAIVSFCNSIRRSLEAHFDPQSLPLVLTTSFPDVLSVEFALATIIDANEAEEMAAARAQAQVHAAAGNDDDDDDGFGGEWHLSQADTAFLESEAAWGNMMEVDEQPLSTATSQAGAPAQGILTASTQSNSQAINNEDQGNDDDTIIEERRRSRKRVKPMFSGDD